jgi:Na+-translocating ferredoxin:NAD+ oxidoreductase RnfD subunit
MVRRIPAPDPRHFQFLFQAFFLGYGILFLDWNADWVHYSLIIIGCLVFSYSFESISQKKFLPLQGRTGWKAWGLSVLISAMGLCLLLKTNHWWTCLLAAFLAVLSKTIFRFNKKHIFNPSAFGIVATILLTHDAWLSPGQWGNHTILFFLILTLGTIVVTRVQKLDTSIAFLFTFTGLLYWRQVLVLGWPLDHFMHSVSTGGLLLFSFFMISDPKTSPNHPMARVIWAMTIAAVSFWLAAFRWKYNTPVWILVAAAPLVPLLDHLFKARPFTWPSSSLKRPAFVSHFHFLSRIKNSFMRSVTRKIAAVLVLIAMMTNETMAFCGFYVSKADGTLKNKTSQVIIVRDGDRTAITMFNDFKGNPKDFAMVVPVPVVLKQSDIKVIDQQLFTTLNEYSKPRLVEYYDRNPCQMEMDSELQGKVMGLSVQDETRRSFGAPRKKDLGVKIEAKYLVGEYDILILSAKESSGLRTWLTDNGYKIPEGADEVLDPYIKSNLKFFVVKVNEEEKKKLPGDFLRPIQISFSSPKFMLPIRLGMANADGDQDMLVYAFSKKGRIECANYRTVSLPTGRNIPLFVKNNFQNFYANLFQHQWSGEGKSVAMLEYAWDLSPNNYLKCDPCVAAVPSTRDLLQAGVWWVGRGTDYQGYGDKDEDNSNVYFTRLHIRYNRRAFPQDLFFQETPDKENFQARYVITHPATGDLNCEAGRKYLEDLKDRRKDELETLTFLTGKGYRDWDMVMNRKEESSIPPEESYADIAANLEKTGKGNKEIFFATLGMMGLLSVAGLRRQNKARV